jgi:hypothetical protein
VDDASPSSRGGTSLGDVPTEVDVVVEGQVLEVTITVTVVGGGGLGHCGAAGVPHAENARGTEATAITAARRTREVAI